jgi:hypothetical protein
MNPSQVLPLIGMFTRRSCPHFLHLVKKAFGCLLTIEGPCPFRLSAALEVSSPLPLRACHKEFSLKARVIFCIHTYTIVVLVGHAYEYHGPDPLSRTSCPLLTGLLEKTIENNDWKVEALRNIAYLVRIGLSMSVRYFFSDACGDV